MLLISDAFICLSPYVVLSEAAQRDCRKTPGSKNVQKNLPQQAKKQPKYCQNVVRNTKNQTLFSVSLPLFKNNFGKVTFSTVSTVCVSPARREAAVLRGTGAAAGVDSVWEQKKLEANILLQACQVLFYLHLPIPFCSIVCLT
jgi:hypothetical protein